MNSKERLQASLSHRESDRVPMMMSANTWVVDRLKKYLRVYTDRELLRVLNLDLFDMRGIDYKGAIGPIYIGPEFLDISPDWCGDLFPLFNYHEVITETPYGRSYSIGKPPLAFYPTIDELATYPWPQENWFDFSGLRERLEPWAEEFAVVFSGCSIFQHATFFWGIERMLLEMASDPEVASYILDRVADFYYEYTQSILEEAGDLIDIVRLADDIGSAQGLLISPKMIRAYLGPRIQRFADLVHKYNAKLMFHTDGDVREIIPDLITWGVDILDPVQPGISSMAHIELKQEFGERLCFSGGVDTQNILPNKGTDAVVSEIERVIRALSQGGGYILSPGHPCLQGDVPVENIVAMYEAGLQFGQY